MKITSDQVLSHIQKRPGEKLTFTDLAAHFNCGDGPLRNLLKSLVDANKIESTGGTTYSRNIYKATLYYLKEPPEQAYKTTKPLQMTLAKRIALERCAEAIPPNREHHCCTSRLPPNNLDKD